MRASEYKVNPESHTKTFGVYFIMSRHHTLQRKEKQVEALHLFSYSTQCPRQYKVRTNTITDRVKFLLLRRQLLNLKRSLLLRNKMRQTEFTKISVRVFHPLNAITVPKSYRPDKVPFVRQNGYTDQIPCERVEHIAQYQYLPE